MSGSARLREIMSDTRVLVAVAAGAGLVVGFAASEWLRPAAPERREVTAAARARARCEGCADSSRAEIAALSEALDAERGLRGELELRLALLRQEMERRTSNEVPERAAESGPEAAKGKGRASESAPEGDAPHGNAPANGAWFDEASIVARGVGEDRAARLHERFEELQMSEIGLRSDAQREGWLRSPRYGNDLRALRADMREEIGDEDYDLLLYAAGRNNRVILRDVLSNSPAAAAGIEPGDVLLRYAGRPIFDGHELRAATSAGKRGSTVAVDVRRSGEVFRVYLPRGPIGARLQPTRQFPDELE